MSVISSGNRAFKRSSCTRRRALSASANFLAKVDFLPQSSRREKSTSQKYSCSQCLSPTNYAAYDLCDDLCLQNSPLADQKTVSRSIGFTLNGAHLSLAKLHVTHYKGETRS